MSRINELERDPCLERDNERFDPLPFNPDSPQARLNAIQSGAVQFMSADQVLTLMVAGSYRGINWELCPEAKARMDERQRQFNESIQDLEKHMSKVKAKYGR